MFKNILIFLATSLAMIGCANKGPAIQAKQEATAELIFPISTAQWESGKIQLATKNAKGCGEFSQNILADSYASDLAITIEADKDNFYHISRTYNQMECSDTGLFYAIKGHEYTLNIELIEQNCVVSLFEKPPFTAKQKIKTFPAHASKIDGVKVCENRDKL